MKKRQIEITIETAKRWYNNGNLEMKQLALEGFPELEEKELPKSWKALNEINGWFINSDSEVIIIKKRLCCYANENIFATKKQAEASIALAQLSQLREVYRNGWIPDWKDGNKLKFCIHFAENKISTTNYLVTDCFLSFKDEKTRDLFLENFHKLIEQAKPLMQ